MAGKFLELEEAASKLGVTSEQLIEMRSKGTIFGYRDGSSWKFKQEEVERVLQERSDGGDDEDDSEILTADNNEFENFVTGLSSKIQMDSLKAEDDEESILLSEDELDSHHGGSGSMKLGSVIKDGSHKDGDIQFAEGSQLGSDALSHSSSAKPNPSDILSGSAPRGPGATDLMSGSAGLKDDSGKLGDDGELALDSLSDLSLGSDSKKVASGTDSGLSNSDEFSLDDDDDLMLASDGSGNLSSADAPSAPSLEGEDAGDFDLGLDDDLSVLGDEPSSSGRGSDVTHGGGDSGINLAPSDGGLSLEDGPSDLGGSFVESLELPEDDDVIELENAADPDQATQLKADDQFMLSASDALEEDESDSGSQVIALEDSESFDQDAATMLNAQQQMDAGGLVADDAYGQAGMMGGAAAGASPAYQGNFAPQPVEIPYSIWQVLSLFILTGILTVTGMLMVDVMANMWTWEGNGKAATFVMDAVISTVGLDK